MNKMMTDADWLAYEREVHEQNIELQWKDYLDANDGEITDLQEGMKEAHKLIWQAFMFSGPPSDELQTDAACWLAEWQQFEEDIE